MYSAQNDLDCQVVRTRHTLKCQYCSFSIERTSFVCQIRAKLMMILIRFGNCHCLRCSMLLAIVHLQSCLFWKMRWVWLYKVAKKHQTHVNSKKHENQGRSAKSHSIKVAISLSVDTLREWWSNWSKVSVPGLCLPVRPPICTNCSTVQVDLQIMTWSRSAISKPAAALDVDIMILVCWNTLKFSSWSILLWLITHSGTISARSLPRSSTSSIVMQNTIAQDDVDCARHAFSNMTSSCTASSLVLNFCKRTLSCRKHGFRKTVQVTCSGCDDVKPSCFARKGSCFGLKVAVIATTQIFPLRTRLRWGINVQKPANLR